MRIAGEEVEDDVTIGEMSDLDAIGRGEAAQQREAARPLGAPLGLRQRLAGQRSGAERIQPPLVGDEPLDRPDDLDEFASHASDVSPQAVMPCPPRMTPIASGRSCWIVGDVESELETRSPPGHPGHPVAEAPTRQRLAVGGRCEGDARIRV